MRALEVLRSDELAPIVALAAWLSDGHVEVASSRGHARMRLPVALAGGDEVEVVDGANPIADTDPAGRGDDCFPYAWQRLAVALRAGPRAPDIAVVHTGAHFWPERGGHLGEHGSLNAPQSRAPLVVSGPGVDSSGLVDGVARVTDVADLLAALAGVPVAPGRRLPLPVGPGARHVVGLLWDGVPSEELLALAGDGTLPHLARLLGRGCALTGGAIAEFPSVTLVNHAAALTGVGPDLHRIVNNAFFDRDTSRSVVANHASTWHRACDLLADGVTTVFERVAAARPGVRTACVNEPVDRGADYSTFGLVRASGSATGAAGLADALPDASQDPHATHDFVSDDRDYAWATSVDAAGLQQILTLWSDGQPPALTWWNFTLTDSGHHAGGPGSAVARASLVDTDRRLGEWIALAERRGLLDDTTVLLTADHGSQGADPSCRGDWDEALAAAGVNVRDEAYGFLYLDGETRPTRTV